jgi:hypothetical protein
MREDRVDHARVVVVQQRHHLLAAERLAEGGEVAQVAEQECHLAGFSDGRVVAKLLDPFSHLRREVAAEPLPAAVLVGDAVDEVNRASGARVMVRKRRATAS